MNGLDSDDFKLDKNIDFAIEYWKMAAEKNFELSCLNLARLYTQGMTDPHIPIDFAQAKEYVSRVLNNNVSEKMFKDEAQILLENILKLQLSHPMSLPQKSDKKEKSCVIL
jgi:TPR repeat protein